MSQVTAKPDFRRKLGLKLAGLAGVMFLFGFALVPLYDVFCRLTGQNQLGMAESAMNTQVDRTRLVTIEFDTNTNHMPWTFRPMQNSIKVHPGELAQVEFEVRNEKEHPVSGQAIASYGPSFVAQYFRKIECFCFTRQTLAANETRRMPVVFQVDGKLPTGVNTITLSYTFFELPGNQQEGTPRPQGA